MRNHGLSGASDCASTVFMLDTPRAPVYGCGWSPADMYPQQGSYGDVSGNMPQSDFNTQNSWESDHYQNYQYSSYDDNFTSLYLMRGSDEEKYMPPDLPIDQHPSFTSIGKPSPFSEEMFYNKWEDTKPIRQWTPEEVVTWVCEQGRKIGYDHEKINLTEFQDVNGEKLLKMTEHEFLEKDRIAGFFLYRAVRNYEREEEAKWRLNLPHFEDIRNNDNYEGKTLTDLSSNTHNPSDVDSYQSDSSFNDTKEEVKHTVIKSPVPQVRKVGRPPKMGRAKRDKGKKCGRLWEFIRDLLKKPEYCPSLICWENHDEGVFRFVRSDKVAELWGTIKENPKMTYEKLSRAMRYYYKSKVLQPVLGRRLVYKFGPTARDWRSPDPNFRNGSKKAHDMCI